PPCDEGVVLAARPSTPCAEAARPWVLATTVLGSSLAFVDGTVVNLALPALQRELGATVADVQWVVEAYALLLAALLLVGGSLGDRLGRRRIYASGIVLFAAASSACGLARDVRQLVIARAVQGVGAALLVPGSRGSSWRSPAEAVRWSRSAPSRHAATPRWSRWRSSAPGASRAPTSSPCSSMAPWEAPSSSCRSTSSRRSGTPRPRPAPPAFR